MDDLTFISLEAITPTTEDEQEFDERFTDEIPVTVYTEDEYLAILKLIDEGVIEDFENYDEYKASLN